MYCFIFNSAFSLNYSAKRAKGLLNFYLNDKYKNVQKSLRGFLVLLKVDSIGFSYHHHYLFVKFVWQIIYWLMVMVVVSRNHLEFNPSSKMVDRRPRSQIGSSFRIACTWSTSHAKKFDIERLYYTTIKSVGSLLADQSDGIPDLPNW